MNQAESDLPVWSHRTYDRRQRRGEGYWYDPDAVWPANAPFQKSFELPPLDPL